MKTTRLKTESPVKFALAALAIIAGNAFGQNNGNGNNNGNGLWQAAGHDTVFTNRFVKIKNSLSVRDTASANILHAHSYLQVGDSTFFLVPNVPPGVDHIRSDNGRIAILQGDNATFSSNILVGIGTQSPAFTLHLLGDGVNTNGGIVSLGAFGAGPNATVFDNNPNPRFMWYPRKAAFRAGEVAGTEWNDVNIGNHSAAFGKNTIACGAESFAAGDGNTASGTESFAAGGDNIAGGNNSIVFVNKIS